MPPGRDSRESPEPPSVLVHASVVVKDRGNVLLVREGKPANRDLWNLPGGHVEPDETIAAAAERELREETGLGVFLTDLVGVYTGPMRSGDRSVRFVFAGHAVTGDPAPGDDITEVRWFPLPELATLAEDQVVAPDHFFRIVADLESGLTFPMRLLSESD